MRVFDVTIAGKTYRITTDTPEEAARLARIERAWEKWNK